MTGGYRKGRGRTKISKKAFLTKTAISGMVNMDNLLAGRIKMADTEPYPLLKALISLMEIPRGKTEPVFEFDPQQVRDVLKDEKQDVVMLFRTLL
uniref:Uncharacterized protein n=1 Tax=Chromera velia CCMP2878 TaxID=1169474 RepID=A0A0G4F5U0_9ALVE|eukprot:Cvel_2766.t1-p1 / transcript=Cvel_2766.t1 / gene=Cvel_2766 / organism=Chromera_velia_CCMP2878 / gene_product=hypothetical protein / transcript_product=hypothetical protein / location=Cvel_scaffold111:45298-46002(-) / protein_length=94 / sequence_SO=supercontig / SO=protein_coding / is_pseudo=false